MSSDSMSFLRNIPKWLDLKDRKETIMEPLCWSHVNNTDQKNFLRLNDWMFYAWLYNLHPPPPPNETS